MPTPTTNTAVPHPPRYEARAIGASIRWSIFDTFNQQWVDFVPLDLNRAEATRRAAAMNLAYARALAL